MINTNVKNRHGIRWRTIVMLAVLAVGVGLSTMSAAADPLAVDRLEKDFADPPAQWKSRPLWFWNGPLDEGATTRIMEESVTTASASCRRRRWAWRS
jgi:hypothetical protein